MIRRKLKTVSEYAEAIEFKNSLAPDKDYQIRRRRKGFDVVERLAGTKKDAKVAEGTYTKPKKARRKRNDFNERRFHEEDEQVLGR